MTEPATPKPSAAGRLAAGYPLIVGYLVLLTLYAWQTTRHSTPWLFTDELQWAELARGIAHHGHPELRLHRVPFRSFYPYFIAPAWWLGGSSPAYAAAKYLNAAAMTASIFPAYALARLFVPRWPAVCCGFAAAVIPELAYTGLLIPEPLAYPWSTLTLWLVARALLRRNWRATAVALLAVVVAPAVRSELSVLAPAGAIAVAIVFATSARSRRVIGAWTRRDRVGAVTLLVLATIWCDALLIHHSNAWRIGTYFHHRMFTYGLWAFGAFAIGVGVVPVFATLAWLLGARLRRLDERVLFASITGCVIAFGLYTGAKASYLSTILAVRVEERNLIYLAPLAFVATARWMIVGRTRLVAGTVAFAAVAYLLATTPYHSNEHFYSDAPGLAILQWMNRTWRFTTADVRHVLFGILIGMVVVAAVTEVVRGRPGRTTSRAVGVAAGAVLAALVVTWNLTGEIVAANASNSFATSFRSVLPTPPDWVDRVTGRARTMLIGEALGNSNALAEIEFWNQSIGDVWSVDASAPGPGPATTPNFTGVDGEVDPQLPIGWAVTMGKIELSGKVVATVGGLHLYRLDHPIRIAADEGGIAPDGWMGTSAWYNRFDASRRGAKGELVVSLSRLGACGKIPAAHITIRVSRLAIDKNAQPAAGRLESIRRVTVHSQPCQAPVVRIPATPPFRVDVAADRTFQPSPTDRRELSVVIGFAFQPGQG
ncbi:MAG: ArnT family glycosyltransferase [Gaiellaceae bacterium]